MTVSPHCDSAVVKNWFPSGLNGCYQRQKGGRVLTKVYFDGGCRPNPGMMETAVVAGGKLYHRAAIGDGSSEQAEWLALLDAFEVARALGISDLVLLGDSVGVVRQANGTVRERNANALACRARFAAGSDAFGRVRVRHVRRGHNLAGIALGQMRQGRIMAIEPWPQEQSSERSLSS